VEKSNERSVYLSIRMRRHLKDQLTADARRHKTNLNALINTTLEKHVSFDSISEHVRAIPVNQNLFAAMLESVSEERMEGIGIELGPRLIRNTFLFLNIKYDLDNLIEHYFEPLGSFSGWYNFSSTEGGPNRKLIFEHTHGPKWSAFLKRYIAGIIKAATGVEPRITLEDGLLVAYC
jgi:hypothetical protein